MRALINIDELQIREFDRLAKEEKQSRAALVRQAINDFLKKQSAERAEDAFGLWGKRKIDGPSTRRRFGANGEGVFPDRAIDYFKSPSQSANKSAKSGC
ncbi:ribbon-helix-helix domain-containing protein [Phyllobacterium zundukense]|uniref:ribbon-helix-helix domain-containing protein n=1 Tax=Phyllobacterium zundukense TaxID=1867719 RepID=UPI001F1666E6|nr:ribbon-helix-helix domain-containing protein [Phyllobacterium zundukense]